MTMINMAEVQEHDARGAAWWCDAAGQRQHDLDGETVAEARDRLLDECATPEEFARMLAGSIELAESDEPDPNRFYEWTVKIRVSATWVADGFDLDADRLHDMVAADLRYAAGYEIETEIVTGPSAAEIRHEQGYQE